MLKKNRAIFDEVRGKKIILNKTSIDETDVRVFETQVGTKVFKCVKSFNDRAERVLVIDELLVALGFTKQMVEKKEEKSKRKFSFFK